MALKFNLEYLKSICKSPIVFINTLRYYSKKHPVRVPGLPKNYDSRKMYGESFLLNPDNLFNDRSTDPLFVYQYITLAARRDYAMYILYGAKYLDLSYYPDLQLDKIKYNPLLKIAGNKLHFKYEETQNGNRIRKN